MSNAHELKCFPDRFQQILDGTCKADIRFDDRKYKAGDIIIFYEGYSQNGIFIYTNRVMSTKITYVDAVQEGFAVLSLEKLC